MDFLQSIGSGMSLEEKWHTLQLILVFNGIVGFGFLLSALTVSGVWGKGASFQVVITALIHAIYCAFLLQWVRKRETIHADFLGGVSVMLSVMLLQTAALWGGLTNGMDERALCEGQWKPPASSAARAVTAFSSINFIGHLVLSLLVFIWKQELLGVDTHVPGMGPSPSISSGRSTTSFGYSNIGSSLESGYQQGQADNEINVNVIRQGGIGSTRDPDKKFAITDDAEL